MGKEQGLHKPSRVPVAVSVAAWLLKFNEDEILLGYNRQGSSKCANGPGEPVAYRLITARATTASWTCIEAFDQANQRRGVAFGMTL